MTARLMRVTALAGCLLAPAPGWAADKRDLAAELGVAQAALAAGDYAKAYPAYLAHSQDNALAQFSIGLFHQYGWGRPINPAEACRWQEKAAAAKIPAAQQLLGDCLRRGLHRPADPAQAAHWYEQAIRSGIPIASCSLAELTMNGEGVAKNPQRAIELCRSAAEKSLPVAQVWLARLYLEGDSSIRDPAAARQWLQMAAQANHADAQYRLGLMLRDGIGQPADAHTARWWLETAAVQGWLPAYLPTATLYFNAPADPATGMLPAEDLAKAYLWSAAASKRLAGHGHAEQAQALFTQVRANTPQTWQASLDQQVAAHLAKFDAPRPEHAPLASTPAGSPPSP